MTTPVGWRIVDNTEDWMRQQEKRSMHEARRPQITHAADLLGPGIGPYAIQVKDWNAEETKFNGHFYSAPNAMNSPDPLLWWIGNSISQVEGFGIQQVWDYRGVSVPPLMRTRRFSLVGPVRVFSQWA